MRLDNLIAAEEYLTLAAATVDSADIGLSLVIKSSFTELYTKKGQNQKALSYAYDYTYLASKNGFTEKALYGRQLIDTILNGLNLQDQVLFEKIDYKKNKDIETQTDFQSIKERGLRNFIDILLILIVLFLGYRLVKTKK